ncbi:UDP-N-acetylmuramoylalanine--D-glutamate ligase OS=Stutzerimonas stutzeri OX=316 GN=murD PE=3 SV=1 [Stutzerimonas stutzeri]
MLIASDQFRIVVGLGKSGMSVVRHLARRGLPFAVADTRANPPELATLKAQYPGVEVRCGELDVEFLVAPANCWSAPASPSPPRRSRRLPREA